MPLREVKFEDLDEFKVAMATELHCKTPGCLATEITDLSKR